jgi:hypothetical protein
MLPIRQATSEIQFFTQAVENIFTDGLAILKPSLRFDAI